MATTNLTTSPPPAMKPNFWARFPGAGVLRNLSIGNKLNIGFGILVILALLGAGVSVLGSGQARAKIDTTEDVRVPTALASAQAQADLLRMLSAVRGYLALGDG
ncbi:MAG: hypothetical protein R3264_18330, partial [Anaerolineae bacterium]|nr:hypothetical protein [Anaerolineae bacterium]